MLQRVEARCISEKRLSCSVIFHTVYVTEALKIQRFAIHTDFLLQCVAVCCSILQCVAVRCRGSTVRGKGTQE